MDNMIKIIHPIIIRISYFLTFDVYLKIEHLKIQIDKHPNKCPLMISTQIKICDEIVFDNNSCV